jgi:mono/diheme cytochrome c family protein
VRNLTIGFILAFIVIAVCGYLYLEGGYAPVATASSPLPFEARIAHMALNAVVRKQAPKNAPIPADEENVVAGAKVYRANCAVCHGLPGQPETGIAQGMFPKVPQLFKGKGVTDDPAGVTYWKAANGIRLSGMPGFKGSLSETELWQVSLLLANADTLPSAAQTILSAPLPPM